MASVRLSSWLPVIVIYVDNSNQDDYYVISRFWCMLKTIYANLSISHCAVLSGKVANEKTEENSVEILTLLASKIIENLGQNRYF